MILVLIEWFYRVKKTKSDVFKKMILELNSNTRWFSILGDAKEEKSNRYKEVVTFVRNAKRLVKRDEIKEAVATSRADLTRILSKAVELEDLATPKFGYYSCPKLQENNQELALEE